MKSFVALVRGINVGGNKLVAMSALRELLAHMGFEDPRSLLQSGNLIFRANAESAGSIERRLERETESRLQHRVDFLVRTADEWTNIVGRNPFPAEASSAPGHLVVMCLKGKPSAGALKVLEGGIVGREMVRADGKHLYITYPDGIGRSRLTHSIIERALGLRGTARNWNTVVKIHELLRATGS